MMLVWMFFGVLVVINMGLILGAIAGATLRGIFARRKRQDVKQTTIPGPTSPLPMPLSGQTHSQHAPLPDRHKRLAGRDSYDELGPSAFDAPAS